MEMLACNLDGMQQGKKLMSAERGSVSTHLPGNNSERESLLKIVEFFDQAEAKVKEVEQPAGAAFMIKRHVLETLGPLNNCYHMFFEDVDLCFRIRDNGWKVYYLPDAVVNPA